jgi:hypothetical protein
MDGLCDIQLHACKCAVITLPPTNGMQRSPSNGIHSPPTQPLSAVLTNPCHTQIARHQMPFDRLSLGRFQKNTAGLGTAQCARKVSPTFFWSFLLFSFDYDFVSIKIDCFPKKKMCRFVDSETAKRLRRSFAGLYALEKDDAPVC